jgi:hypothetical protein
MYVWIDSICIIQDDADDWDKHCATMATIYRNASLVLAATASKDGQGGLFRERSTKLEFTGADRTGNPVSMFARREIGHSAFTYNSSGFIGLHKDLEGQTQMPLLFRAWAFQERLISGAIVHFMDEELIWECLECHQCECGWSSAPHPYAPPLPLRRLLRGAEPEPEPKPFTMDRAAEWEDLAQDYTRKDLTFRKDLLPALSALAIRYGQSRDKHSAGTPQDTYLAGLWNTDLRTQMVWFPAVQERREQVSSDATAPSWSWISSPGAVLFSEEPMDIHVDILDAKCYLKGLNPYGEVDGGYVRIRGPLLQAVVRSQHYPYISIYHIEDPANWCFFTPNDPATDTSKILYNDPVFCLRWCTSRTMRDAGEVWALILSPVEDADRPAFLQDVAAPSQIYRRIGITRLYSLKWSGHEVEREILIV